MSAPPGPPPPSSTTPFSWITVLPPLAPSVLATQVVSRSYYSILFYPLSYASAVMALRGPGMSYGDAQAMVRIDPDAYPPQDGPEGSVRGVLLEADAGVGGTLDELYATGMWRGVQARFVTQTVSVLGHYICEPLVDAALFSATGLGWRKVYPFSARTLVENGLTFVLAPFRTAWYRYASDLPSFRPDVKVFEPKYSSYWDALVTGVRETGWASMFKICLIEMVSDYLIYEFVYDAMIDMMYNYLLPLSAAGSYSSVHGIIAASLTIAVVDVVAYPLHTVRVRLAVDGQQPVEAKGERSTSAKYSFTTGAYYACHDLVARHGPAGLFHGYEFSSILAFVRSLSARSCDKLFTYLLSLRS